jgi:hypothetical protein
MTVIVFFSHFFDTVDMDLIRQGNFLISYNLTKFLNDINDQNLLLATVYIAHIYTFYTHLSLLLMELISNIVY